MCSGIDPGKVVYKQHEFCSHFLECLKKRELNKFTMNKNEATATATLQLLNISGRPSLALSAYGLGTNHSSNAIQKN